MDKAKPFVIVGVTGSIAAYKACDILSMLAKERMETQAILTSEAREFITPLSLQTLSRNKVLANMFELPEEWSPLHISLADKANAILIAPATANIIGRLAGGICDDLLTCIVYATKAPILIAPAMNDRMYDHPITQENISRLKKLGYKFIGPVKGRLACGRDAVGCLADTADIIRELKRIVK